MFEHQYAKNVKIVCSIGVGDVVRTMGWGRQFDGKDLTVLDMKFESNTETGVMIQVEDREGKLHWLDSNWFCLVSKKQKQLT